MFGQWFLRLRALFRREAVEAELDQKLGYHLDREIERNLGDRRRSPNRPPGGAGP